MRHVCACLAMTAFLSGCGVFGSKTDEGRSAVKELAASMGKAPAAQALLLSHLQKAKAKVSLAELLSEQSFAGALDPELRAKLAALDSSRDLVVDVPVAAHRARLATEEAIWVFVPVENEKQWQDEPVRAVDVHGNELTLDPQQAPSQPVITLARDEALQLAKNGLPILDAKATEVQASSDTATHAWSEMIRRIEFTDVHEPWVKGDAELYLTVTYVDKDGKGHSELVSLQGVTEANKSYYLDKVFFYWSNNKYQILDIAFFEHDSGYNYAQLANIFVGAAATVVSVAQPQAALVAKLVSGVTTAVIKALPSGTMTDDDDFIDVMNTVQKYANGMRKSVNGKVTLESHTWQVPFNDE